MDDDVDDVLLWHQVRGQRQVQQPGRQPGGKDIAANFVASRLAIRIELESEYLG